MITTAQIRGARGVLNWSQGDLSERTGITATSIGEHRKRIDPAAQLNPANYQKAFEDAGIEFLAMEGIRFRTNYIQNLRGRDGFSDFLDDVYKTAITHGTKEIPTKIYLSNVVHENWIKWMGKDKWNNHTERMIKKQRCDGCSYHR